MDFSSCRLADVVLTDGLAGDPEKGEGHEAEEGGDNQRPADALGRAQAQVMVEPIGEEANGQRAETQADQVMMKSRIAAVVARMCGGTIDWAVP